MSQACKYKKKKRIYYVSQKTLPDIASYMVMLMGNNIFNLDSIYFLLCCFSHCSSTNLLLLMVAEYMVSSSPLSQYEPKKKNPTCNENIHNLTLGKTGDLSTGYQGCFIFLLKIQDIPIFY
jgi:hypothetical protein